MITNINAIQFEKNGIVEDEAKREYLVQSVANLGQRAGVKGDSLVSNSFSFRELFEEIENTNQYTSSSYIGCVQRKNGAMYVGIYPKSSLVNATSFSDSVELSISNASNILFNNAAFDVSIEESGISFFKAGSIISARSSNYMFCGIGCDYGNKPKEFVYEEFKRDGNSSNSILRSLKYAQLNGHNIVLSMATEGDSVLMSLYELQSGDEVFQNTLDSIYSHIHILNGDILNGDDYDNFGSTNEANINKLSTSYWENYLKTYKSTYYLKNIKFALKENGSIDWDSSSESLAKFSKYTGFKTLVTQSIEYGSSMLDDIKRVYSETLFASSNNEFRLQILSALFNAIYDKSPSKAVLYIPIDYEFNYYCNSNDSWKIYGNIDDINVRFVNKTITPYNISSFYSDHELLANISGENRSALYGFSVDYDSNDSDLVYAVNAKKLYSLPYINDDNYWVVNDNITNVNANGENAGNPNIIIIYNYDKLNNYNSYKILHCAESEMLSTNSSSFVWENALTYVPPIDKININNLEDNTVLSKNDLLKVFCHVPKIVSDDDNDVLSFLKYSLIINISTLSCVSNVDDVIRKKYGANGTITTFWSFNKDTLSFEVLTNPAYNKDDFGIVAMDFTAMSNLNNLVKWHIENAEYKHPDKYSHKWLVLDNANYLTKNNTNDYQSYIYPVIANKHSADFNATNYYNNLNLFLKYNDKVSGGEEENITLLGNTNSKYLNSNSLAITNSLYYKTNNSKTSRYNEYVPNVNMPMLNLSEVFTQDANLLNRANIVSFNDKGNMFYSYIGTSFDDENKNHIHIGSSTTNINFGAETMISENNRDIFKAPNELHIDFDKSFINGYAYVSKNITVSEDIYVEHLNWTVTKTKNITLYKTNFIPESKMMTNRSSFEYYLPLQFNNYREIVFSGSKQKEKMIDGQMKRYAAMASTFDKTSTSLENDYIVWIPSFFVFDEKYSKRSNIVYNGEMLYLPGLLCKLRLTKYLNKLYAVNVKSNMDVVTYNRNPLMLATSNRFAQNIEYSFNELENTWEAIWESNTNELFVGNSLDISYYEKDNKLYLTINEGNKTTKISNLFKLKLNY